MATEKFIVAVKQWGLGYLKETVYQGTVLVVDRDKNTLTIDGRQFNDVRDIDIAKRQAERFPNNPLIVPFTDEDLRRLRNLKAASAPPPAKPRPGENMKVVQSDADLHEDIDIAHTQVSRVKREAKETERNRVKTDGMPIIKGDETPEERVERIRAEKLAAGKMPIVQDDGTLGVAGGSKAAALNAGQKLPNRAEIEEREAIVRAQAEARKREAEAKRPVTVTADAEGNSELQTLVTAADAPAGVVPTPVEVPAPTAQPTRVPVLAPSESDAKVEALSAQVSQLASAVGQLADMVKASQVRRPVGRPKKS